MKNESWSNERRAQQAAVINRTKPWERSTGPRTETGKIKVAKNAEKHGLRGGIMRQVADFLAKQNRLLKELEK